MALGLKKERTLIFINILHLSISICMYACVHVILVGGAII